MFASSFDVAATTGTDCTSRACYARHNAIEGGDAPAAIVQSLTGPVADVRFLMPSHAFTPGLGKQEFAQCFAYDYVRHCFVLRLEY
jgi:hypothetical protein